MIFKWLTALFFVFSSLYLSSQTNLNDTIYFMNGDILQCEIIDDSQIEVVFEFQKGKKRKEAGVHKSEIFGIVNNGEKEIYYEENEVVGDDLSVAEVEVFLAGQRDARSLYSSKRVFYSGLGLSLATSIAGEAGLLAITVPLVVYPAAQYIPYIKIKEKTIVNPNHKYNLIYAEGYEGVARGKRVLAAIKGSAAGAVVGSLFFRLVLR